jgi:hypothetical protein
LKIAIPVYVLLFYAPHFFRKGIGIIRRRRRRSAAASADATAGVRGNTSTTTRPGLHVAIAIVAAGIASNVFAQGNRGPSTSEEREEAVRLVRGLELNPLSGSAKRDRQWLTLWLVAIPDIKVSLCTEFFPQLLVSKKNHASELVTQSPYSIAAFVIEHPEKAEDDDAKFQAGVEGTLKAYEAILKKEPQAHWPILDELLLKRDKGELGAFIHATVPKCRGK